MDEGIELIKKLLENLDTPNAELNAIWTRESDTRIDAYKLLPPLRRTQPAQMNVEFLSLRNRLHQPRFHFF